MVLIQLMLEGINCFFGSVLVAKANEYSTGVEEGPPSFLVNCPKYPFDHSRRYWHETRLSRDYRLRGKTAGKLLGRRSHDWNPLEPSWRNFFSLESIPWLADHVVTGLTICPGAALLIMAVEAVNEVSSSDGRISGFFVKEAHFLRPLVVTETNQSATETLLRLRRPKQVYEKESTWSEVTIFSYSDDHWTECFYGKIQVQCEETTTEVDCGKEKRLRHEQIVKTFEHMKESCRTGINSPWFYSFCQDLGIDYGSSFQLLEGIQYTPGKSAIAHIDVSKSAHQSSGIAHPTTLDAAIHLAIAQMSRRSIHSTPAIVPRQLKNAWISTSRWGHPQTTSIRLLSVSKGELNGIPNECSLYALADDGSVLCAVENLHMASVSRNEATTARPETILYGIEWKPQLSLLSSGQLQSLCSAAATVSAEDQIEMVDCFLKLDSAMITVVDKVLKEVAEADLQNAPSHLRQYTTTMRHYLETKFRSRVRTGICDQEVNSELEQCINKLPGLEMCPLIARNLKSILGGEVDPLELIFSTGAAEMLYDEVLRFTCDGRLGRFLELITHENPALRILEVGAGTGSVTKHVLSFLADFERETGASFFREYVYTDVSASFLDNARASFQQFEGRMTFKTFDLEHDAYDQGFKPAAYDVIIAGSVFHATADLMATLRNVRKLLKPGGRLITLELISPNIACLNIVFGVLPGWWLGKEEWRRNSPLATEEQWDLISKSAGFSGNDLIIRDFESDSWHTSSILVTTAIEHLQTVHQESRLVFVVDSVSEKQADLEEIFRRSGASKTLFLGDLPDLDKGVITKNDIVVSLLELEKPFLAEISQVDFHSLQCLIQQAKRLLWVTSCITEDSNHPKYSLIVGLLRTVRSEAVERHIVTLSIETRVPESAEKCADHIARVLETTFTSGSPELEFVVRDGLLQTGRLVGEIALNRDMRSLIHSAWETGPWLPGPALKLQIGTPGALDTFRFVEDVPHDNHLSLDQLGPNEIEIEATAWPVSFRDIFIALGRLPGEELGFECAGIVRRVGPKCRPTFQPGQKIPDGVSFELAVSTPKGRKGPYTLCFRQYRANGPLDCKMLGAEIFATVGFNEKKELLIEKFDLRPDHIFYSRNTSFAQGIMRVTDGQGVDVVLNSLSGEGLRASWECIAQYGRFVEIGKADIMSNATLPMSQFARNVSFFALDLHHMVLTRRKLVRSILEALLDLLDRKQIHYPSPIHQYPLSDVEGAFRYIQSGKNTGRVVISINPSEEVSRFVKSQDTWMFHRDATYLVVGGLGGIGREITKWIATKGAKHIILPSRSGPVSPAASELISHLKARGVNIATPICDVSQFTSISEVLNDCARRMPPIRGCINAAMVLQDAVFQNMSYEQWELTIRSKVSVSWNLHQLLPRLDFFVLLSSLSGIYGSASQANYAAGCTFQDALARHRTSKGEKAISLDLGWMRTIGIIAETESYRRHRDSAGDMIQLEEEELMAVLALYCRPSSQKLSPAKSQLLMGPVTPAYCAIRNETPKPFMLRPLFSTMGRTAERAASGVRIQKTDNTALLFRQAKVSKERSDIVTSALATKLARALSIPIEDVQSSNHLPAYGVDSLMAIELRNWVSNTFQADVAVFDILGNRTITEIGDLVAEKSLVRHAPLAV
ncbi:KR domain-containing protein [Xylaria longipes]|nr:KR domain-containing protein [Xylaria longipes]